MELTATSLGGFNLVAGLAALVVSYVLVSAIANIFSSPIPASVPGPLLARLTRKWIVLVELTGRRGRVVHALHARYGPVVRLAPDELSFAGPDAVRPIYGPAGGGGGGGAACLKSAAYDTFGRPERMGLFQMRDPDQHRRRVKRVAHVFSPGSLLQMEPLMQTVISELCNTVRARLDEPVDALHRCRMAALDISGEVLLAKSFGAVNEGEEAAFYVRQLDAAYPVWMLEGLAPSLCKLLSYLPVKRLRDFLAAGDDVYKYGDDALADHVREHGRASHRRTVLTKLLAGDAKTGAGPLTDAEIGVEIANLVFAATDTTGNTMTYSLYRLCRHPAWQRRLRDEVRGSGARGAGFAFASLQALPVLNGVLSEVLRLHPAVPSSLPRVAAKGVEIGGLWVPEKTLVSMQALTTQRDPAFFARPEEFDPGRWIAPDGTVFQGTPEQREMMLVWGKGSRACLGQQMATMEIKILLARLMDEFEVCLKGDSVHLDMEMTDHFTLIPKGGKCELIFSEAQGSVLV